MNMNLLYSLRYRQTDALTKVYLAQSRVEPISCSACLKREIDLQIALSQLYLEQSQRKPLWQRIRDRKRQWTSKLYRAAGFEEWERLILEQFLFLKHKSLTAKHNLSNSWLGWAFATSVLTIAVSELLESPALQETLLEIAMAATPHMGVTTTEQLNRTAQVGRHTRAGLEK